MGNAKRFIALKEILRREARFSRDVERVAFARFGKAPTTLNVVVSSAVVQLRRVLEAVPRLGREYGPECMALARISFDVWSNMEWIHLEDTEHRADDFGHWLSIHESRIHTDLPNWAADEMRIAAWEIPKQQAEQHLKAESGGRRPWPKMEQRLNAIAKAHDLKDNQYWVYRILSGSSHGEANGLARLIDNEPNGSLKAKTIDGSFIRSAMEISSQNFLLTIKFLLEDEDGENHEELRTLWAAHNRALKS